VAASRPGPGRETGLDGAVSRLTDGAVAALTVAGTIRFVPVGISGLSNNQAISAATDTGAGHFNVWGNSFPAEQLPPPGSRVQVAGVPFDFPVRGPGGDNIRCGGQFVAVPPGRYDWLHLLAAAERRAEDAVALHFEDGEVDFEALRISDFWAAPARFGEHRAFESSVMHYPHHVQPRLGALLWSQRVPVTRRQGLTAVRLPRNIAVHIFAVTLQGSVLWPQPGPQS
jgi:hypothetical protein